MRGACRTKEPLGFSRCLLGECQRQTSLGFQSCRRIQWHHICAMPDAKIAKDQKTCTRHHLSWHRVLLRLLLRILIHTWNILEWQAHEVLACIWMECFRLHLYPYIPAAFTHFLKHQSRLWRKKGQALQTGRGAETDAKKIASVLHRFPLWIWAWLNECS